MVLAQDDPTKRLLTESKADSRFSRIDDRTGSRPDIPATGVTRRNLGGWNSRLGRVRLKEASTKALFCGDSTTLGYGGGAVGNSMPYKLKVLIDGYLARAVNGATIPPNNNIVNDPRWVAGTGWAIAGTLGWGGRSAYRATSGTTGTLTFTPGVTCDTFDVYYYVSATNAAIPMSIDGGPVTNAAASPFASGVGKTTLTVAAGANHVLSIGPTGGNTWITHVDAHLSTERSVRIANAGASGSTAAAWVGGGAGFNGPALIESYAPGLMVLSLGINDSTAAVSTATFIEQMTALINAGKKSGDVIVWTNPPSADLNGRVAIQASYRDALMATCRNLGVPLVDVFARWGSFEKANAAGFMSDTVHPSIAGYDDIASAIFEVLTYQ